MFDHERTRGVDFSAQSRTAQRSAQSQQPRALRKIAERRSSDDFSMVRCGDDGAVKRCGVQRCGEMLRASEAYERNCSVRRSATCCAEHVPTWRAKPGIAFLWEHMCLVPKWSKTAKNQRSSGVNSGTNEKNFVPKSVPKSDFQRYGAIENDKKKTRSWRYESLTI